MGAVVIESISIPRFRRKSIAASSSPPVVAFSILSSFGSRGLRFSTAFNGLRIEKLHRRVTSAVGATSRRVVDRRGAAVVCEAQDTAIDVRDVTKDTWKSFVIECDKPVLVEFWAPWCGPCRVILPIIGKLSKIYEGKMECYKLNTDECPDIATQYGIRSIPTIMIFKNGEKKDSVIGAVPESTLVTCFEKFV